MAYVTIFKFRRCQGPFGPNSVQCFELSKREKLESCCKRRNRSHHHMCVRPCTFLIAPVIATVECKQVLAHYLASTSS